MKHRAYIALGSNIDAERNLPAAVAHLATIGKVLAASPIYETAALGNPQDPRFLNAVVRVQTSASPAELIRGLKEIEAKLCRVRSSDPNAPRTIDLDLIVYDDDAQTAEGRRLPSPEILQRAFVAVPLADLAPDECHYHDGRTYAQIARALVGDAPDMLVRADVDLIPVGASKR